MVVGTASLALACSATAAPARRPSLPAVVPPPAAPSAVETPAQRVLRLVNGFRSTAGLPGVVLDAKLSVGCMEHARYMRLNRDTDAMAGLNAHHQRANLPGATPAGAACGAAADLFPGVADLGTAVDGWMAGFYHRRPILDPDLRSIGVGYAPLPDGTLMAAVMFDDASGSAEPAAVAYPANGQTGVPLQYGSEIPDPVPSTTPGGYPVTLQVPAFDALTGVTAKLVGPDGRAVPIYLSTPEAPATSFGQYGVICLIATRPLTPATTYRVVIDATWSQRPSHWDWSFTTVALRRVDASDDAAITAAVGTPSLMRGTVIYGGMMDSDTVFLTLGPDGAHPRMVSVIIDLEQWKLVTGTAAPAAFLGATIEVQATPQLVQSQYLNLPVALAAHLRVIARP